MRRRISLFIGDLLADLDDQSFILFNYTMEDLSNPTIVKNSFSQSVTLPGTPSNNRIFGEYFRLDRTIVYGGETGISFNPALKTPFTIYNELGEIVESGYCKLDKVVKKKGIVTGYSVSLYGGLGSFLYGLSYSPDGSKRTLADLIHLGTGMDDELDFTINATTLQDAWDDLYSLWSGGSPTGKWTVINFAPAYNGYPENFSPDKGLLSLPGAGLPADVAGYSPISGYGLVNLSNKQDEWAVKDIRSYLQRPVLSIKAFLDAIADSGNNGGYTVDTSSIDIIIESLALWMTLPTIPSLGSFKQDAGDYTLSMSTSATSGNNVGRWDITGDTVPYGTKVNVDIHCYLRLNMPGGADSYSNLVLYGSNLGDAKLTLVFTQMVAYASDNTVVGGSAVKLLKGNYRNDMETKDLATACGYVPTFPTDEYELVFCSADKVSSGLFEIDKELAYRVEAQDVAYYILKVSVYEQERTFGNANFAYNGDGTTSQVKLFHNYSTSFTATTAYIVNGSGNTITATNPDSLRSGARVTKQMLLSTSGTPADYLLSLCKMLGFYFVTDLTEKKVTILKRNDLYIDETIDLTGMVDTSQDIEIVPLLFDSKWYRFSLEGVGGAFFDEYADVYGQDYGIQMIDTGYDFNEEVKDLLDTSVYRNACAILQRSRYWNIISSGGAFIPSPFIDNGNTITRWNASGQTQDTPISCPPTSATVTYYNSNYNGYDQPRCFKLDLADASGKMVDGKDVLVCLDRFETYASFKITDDLPVMAVANGGNPCWILDEGPGVDIPCFSRYITGYKAGKLFITQSLDFGVPRQLDIPSVMYDPDATIYARAWKAYLSDRYDVDTIVMRCRVNFRGMNVGQELLRKFYFFDNSLWVLNKIVNYSMTTFDPVECEFIRVQDKDDYLTGQDY